jgi:hypothetical protein
MQIEALRKYQKRNSGIDELPISIRQEAYRWRTILCRRWRDDLPAWRYAILCGVAKRLALNPPSSGWGRSMAAKKGGYAVQRRYAVEGRIGKRHPAHYAAACSASQRRVRKKLREDAEERKRMGLPPRPRVWRLPLD